MRAAANLASHGGYRSGTGPTARQHTRVAISCFLATSIAMFAMSALLGHPHFLRPYWLVADLIITPFLISGARRAVSSKQAAKQAAGPASGPMVICYDHCPRDLPRALAEHEISGRISGVLHLAKPATQHRWELWPEVPDIESLLEKLQTDQVQDIIFVYHPALDAFTAGHRQELLAKLLAYPARIWLAFDVAANLPDMLADPSGGCKIVPIVTDRLVNSRNATKRCFDLVGSIILLVMFAPLLALFAGLVRASGPGPVIFRQIRTGAHNRKFTVLKFRTMSADPNRPFQQARRNDPRVTRFGRFLRRTSLDELLQLINVIRGDMSLVGPRPHAPETQVEGVNFENAVRLYRLRHRVKPGITGLAQVRGQRGETREICMLEQRLASDLEYIQSWSPWLDISILLQTLPAIIVPTNAH
jgi:exopolysaccharide biosynthesis polyprenyl glycosylphosphotransferase